MRNIVGSAEALPLLPGASLADATKVDLASSGGAALLGAGIGLLAAPLLGTYAVPLAIAGGVLHVWAMVERRRGVSGTRPWWSEALFWGCWVILAAVALFVAAGR